MENLNKKETVVNDNNPWDIRIGRFPIFRNENHSNKSALRSNRYLNHQCSRIKDALTAGKVEKAVLIWLCLIKLSKAYQVLLFTKVKRQWYIKWSKEQIAKDLKDAMNQCRTFNLSMNLERYYLKKPNGKFRPIGSPTVGSKMISKALTDMWVTLSEPHRSEMQHAFRPGKGTWSAVMSVINKLIEKKDDMQIYEFDLKGFFNTIKRHAVHEAALRYSKLLGNCVRHIMDNTRYTFKKLRTETELIHVPGKHWRGRGKMIYRSGLPQGLPLSPLAATISLENVIDTNGLVLYADDGILIGGEEEFKKFVRKSIEVGAEIAVEKTKIVKDEFKFLGLVINIKEEMIFGENSCRSWYDKDLEKWLKTQASVYSKVPENWDWEVDGGSYITKHEVHIADRSLWHWILVNIGVREFKGCKHVDGQGWYYVNTSSALCSEDLLKDAAEFNLKKLLSFHWKFRKPAESHKMNRYIELGNDWDGWYNANKMNWNLHNIWGNLKN
jgi:hypothetical protein